MAEGKVVKGPMHGGPKGPKPKIKNPGKIMGRIIRYVGAKYKIHCILVLICIIVSALANVQGTMFMKTLIDDYIAPMINSGGTDYSELLAAMIRVALFYLCGVVAAYVQAILMMYVTQGTLRNMRNDLFSHMESLPIRYFDTNAHGDIMSIYTNDIDTLRQMISQSIPQCVSSIITVVSVLVSMIILNIPLTLLTLVMVGVMLKTSGYVASNSSKYFVKQQQAR